MAMPKRHIKYQLLYYDTPQINENLIKCLVIQDSTNNLKEWTIQVDYALSTVPYVKWTKKFPSKKLIFKNTWGRTKKIVKNSLAIETKDILEVEKVKIDSWNIQVLYNCILKYYDWIAEEISRDGTCCVTDIKAKIQELIKEYNKSSKTKISIESTKRKHTLFEILYYKETMRIKLDFAASRIDESLIKCFIIQNKKHCLKKWTQEIYSFLPRVAYPIENYKFLSKKYILKNSWYIWEDTILDRLERCIKNILEMEKVKVSSYKKQGIYNGIKQYFDWIAEELAKKGFVLEEDVENKIKEIIEEYNQSEEESVKLV